MSKDKNLLLILWLITIGLLIKYIPKNKVRHGLLAFLYTQVVTWFFGLVIVEKNLIKYPERLFKKSTKTNFSFEYFLYPSFCAIFNLNYPERKKGILKLAYYFFFSGLITGVEVLAEKHTNLIQYVKWKWQWSFISIGVTFYTSRLFYRWFFRKDFNKGNLHHHSNDSQLKQ